MAGIILSQTFETFTPESVEAGDAEERGFDWEDTDYTFRELVDLIERGGFIHPSNSHGTPSWLSTESETTDYSTGETEIKSLHPGKDPRSQRYWAKACNYCSKKGYILH